MGNSHIGTVGEIWAQTLKTVLYLIFRFPNVIIIFGCVGECLRPEGIHAQVFSNEALKCLQIVLK